MLISTPLAIMNADSPASPHGVNLSLRIIYEPFLVRIEQRGENPRRRIEPTVSTLAISFLRREELRASRDVEFDPVPL